MNKLRPCIIIPCYNHGRELSQYLPLVAEMGVDIIVMNDGSNAEESALITQACRKSAVRLIQSGVNQGKWAAVLSGMQAAQEAGYTHALQCDSDGQHNPCSIPEIISKAESFPEHVIVGQPQYGDDAPSARLYGRRITNFFVQLETAGACRLDAMCGFRMYPIAPVVELIRRYGISPGMAGDIEMLVRIYWSGIPVTSIPVEVSYPEGGRSNFRMLRDNLIISWCHTCLCTAALLHPWRLVKARRQR